MPSPSKCPKKQTVRTAVTHRQITIAADTDKIWIENSCTPLTEEQLAYIYEPFYRVDDTRAASGGNGLGLYVVRELLKKEGFRHVFEPVEDGMRFTIFL